MKKIKLFFVGFWNGFKPERLRIYMDLSKYYQIEVCENAEDAEYIICSCFAPYYEYCKYPQVRIMFCGEPYIPDYNLIDYSICEYPIKLFDRNFYYPGCIDYKKHFMKLTSDKKRYGREFVKGKQFFANFINSHESENNIRGDFFKELSKYKRVESAGTYLNNMEGNWHVSFADESKTDFQKKCKFSLCFESTKHQGFVTEKITDAFYAETIPVYFGSEQVFEFFNKNAFIYCHDREDFDRVIRQIVELDSNDDKYLDMINQPILNPKFDVGKHFSDYEKFLKHIFEQPADKAYRRIRNYHSQAHENYLTSINSMRSRKGSLVKRIKSVIVR